MEYVVVKHKIGQELFKLYHFPFDNKKGDIFKDVLEKFAEIFTLFTYSYCRQ